MCVPLLCLCCGGTQMPPIASLSLTGTCINRCGLERQSQLLLCSCFCPAETVLFTARLLRQMAACRAQGRGTDGLPSPLIATLTTTSKHLLTLPIFLSGISPKKNSTMAFILASVRKLMQTETYANLSCPCLPAETQLGACHKAELLPNSLVLHLLLNLNCPPTAFVPVLVRQGNINDFNSICMKQHIACVRLVITYILWYHKCLEEPPGPMCPGRREGKMVGNVKEKIIWEHYDFRANWNWLWY